MGKRIRLTRFGICEQCARRKKCEYMTPRSTSCGQQRANLRFKSDVVEKKKINEIHKEEIERFFSELKYTDRSQVSFTTENTITYVPKSSEIRIKNSRSGYVKKIAGSECGLIRYCENCGKKIYTVNFERRLCDRCHDEICEYLGVNYDNVPKPRKRSKTI